MSRLAVQKELEAGQLHALTVQGIPLTRSLRCVADPGRYQSRAVRAFIDLMFQPPPCSHAAMPIPLQEEVRTLLFVCCACCPPASLAWQVHCHHVPGESRCRPACCGLLAEQALHSMHDRRLHGTRLHLQVKGSCYCLRSKTHLRCTACYLQACMQDADAAVCITVLHQGTSASCCLCMHAVTHKFSRRRPSTYTADVPQQTLQSTCPCHRAYAVDISNKLSAHGARFVLLQVVGCCSGSKIHTVEKYPGLAGRGPLPSDLSLQKWGMPSRSHHVNGMPQQLHISSCMPIAHPTSATGSRTAGPHVTQVYCVPGQHCV